MKLKLHDDAIINSTSTPSERAPKQTRFVEPEDSHSDEVEAAIARAAAASAPEPSEDGPSAAAAKTAGRWISSEDNRVIQRSLVPAFEQPARRRDQGPLAGQGERHSSSPVLTIGPGLFTTFEELGSSLADVNEGPFLDTAHFQTLRMKSRPFYGKLSGGRAFLFPCFLERILLSLTAQMWTQVSSSA